MTKPNDFFLGVIDFFGIVVPGAILLFFYREQFTAFLELSEDTSVWWIAFFVVAYVLGQLLHSVGESLSDWVDRTECNPYEKSNHYYTKINTRIITADPKILLEIAWPETNGGLAKRDAFSYAYRYLRASQKSNQTVLADIDRRMADYKLFRSLVFVFALDLLHGPEGSRYTLDGIFFTLAILRFLYLYDGAQRITFQYYLLLADCQDNPQQEVKAGNS